MLAIENLKRDLSQVTFANRSTFLYIRRIKPVLKIRGKIKGLRTVKHSDKGNIYTCLSARDLGWKAIFIGNLNSQKLLKIYKYYTLLWTEKMYDKDKSKWFLQEDNDPKHKSRLSNSWKAENGIWVIDWPPNTLDLNPIQNVWSILKLKLCKSKYKSLDQFISSIKREWQSFSRQYAENLTQNMTSRCQTVIENEGDWTKF